MFSCLLAVFNVAVNVVCMCVQNEHVQQCCGLCDWYVVFSALMSILSRVYRQNCGRNEGLLGP